MEGFGKATLSDVFQGTAIESLAIPVGHSLTATWLVILSLSNGMLVEICSQCNDLGNWREVGSLKLRLIVGKVHDAPSVEWVASSMSDFNIGRVDVITHCENDYLAECGLCLNSSSGQELWILAGVAPGSVTVRIPGSSNEFVPEFPIDEYLRTQLTK